MAKVYRCAWESTWFDGQKIVNTFHVQTDLSTASSEPSAAAIRDDLDDALRTKYLALIWTEATLDSFTVTEELLPGDTDIPASASLAIGAAGTHDPSNVDSPTELCALLQLRTATSSRSSRGRMFLPPFMNHAYILRDSWVTGGQLAAITTFADELISGHETTDGEFGIVPNAINTVVYSRHRRVASLTPFTFPVTSWARDAKPHWLRSRGN